jgi:simple sugar transport system ATP-binding protein
MAHTISHTISHTDMTHPVSTETVTPAVEMVGVTKRFGAVAACDDVDFAVLPGEIHGLLGQNGAGKSTLMKLLLGLITPDAGHIKIAGQQVVIEDPIHAAEHGIAMVHQHFSLVQALTVWENIALGDRGRLDPRASIALVEEVGGRYGLEVDPRARIGDLTAGQRQRVELIKCLRRDPNILILDEPTSVLTKAESQELFAVLRTVVRDEQRSVVLISHKLDEILHATDEVTIMRSGRVASRCRTSETSAERLARDMISRNLELHADMAAAAGFATETVDAVVHADQAETPPSGDRDFAHHRTMVRFDNVSVRAASGRMMLDGFDLEVREGEIVGLAGVEGNGQTTVAEVLGSLVTPLSGTVEIGGVEIATGRPGAMVAAGVGVIPEDRHRTGCVLDMSVAENLALLDLETVSGRLFLDHKAMRRRAEELVAEYEIALPSVDAPMRMLSGGNQQKVVLARELARNPRVLVAEQPTHGLDIAAVQYMNQRLRAAARSGIAVLVISTEFEELVALADRIAVIHRGQIMGEMTIDELDMERVGLMMGGRRV